MMVMHLPAVLKVIHKYLFVIPTVITGIFLILYFFHLNELRSQSHALSSTLSNTEKEVQKAKSELDTLKNQDQYKRNEELQKEIKAIEKSYADAVKIYESIQDLKAQKQKTDDYEKKLTLSLSYLSKRNYSSGSAELTSLAKLIESDKQKSASSGVNTTAPSTLTNAPVNNTPPGSGYSVQKVKTEIGEYTVAIIAADMGSTRVIVDTASDSDCRDNCPVLSLGDYVSRNGAFAGINGSYFCPASYPSCAGKTNSFDTLLMNKNKKYFNSDNNVYSSVPLVVFGNGFMRFLGQSSGWGRDTSVDSVLANQPLVLSGGNVAFGGDGDPKKGSKGTRSFVGNKGSTAYIGVVYNATVAEVGYVLKALGLENGLNLDSGGSTALWSGGYKVGPGRNIPNAILFVRK